MYITEDIVELNNGLALFYIVLFFKLCISTLPCCDGNY